MDKLDDSRQADADIEVTPAMVEAGAAAVQEYRFDMAASEAEGIARAVLLAVLSYLERK